MKFVALLCLSLVFIAGGCAGPACHCRAYECPPRFCVPPPVYGEPMHPILRRDGGTVLIPHGQFKDWVKQPDAEPVPAGQ